jgi:hypothetical protein
VLIRRETPEDVEAIRSVHASAFAEPDRPAAPVEVGLVTRYALAMRGCPRFRWLRPTPADGRSGTS